MSCRRRGIAEASILLAVVFLLALYGMILMPGQQGRFRGTAQWCLLVLVCIEAVFMAGVTIGNRPVVTTGDLRSRAGYQDHTQEALSYLRRQDDAFYRVEKYYGSAELFGGGINAFSRYETGKTKPPLALVKLFKLLDRHPDFLDELKMD